MDIHSHPLIEPGDAARWTGGVWQGVPPSSLRGVAIDSRAVPAGGLFVALAGAATDGHDHVASAFANGAAAALVERELPAMPTAMPRLRVADARAALTALARGYRATLDATMITVTGSFGKTTVKELLADMLGAVGVTARTRGNWNNDLGVPLSLLMAPEASRFGVFEVGMNHPGELAPLCALVRADMALVTGVGPVHIEHFPDEAAIAQEKASVYRALDQEGIAVVPLDDQHAAALQAAAWGRRLITVSMRGAADYVARRLDPARGVFELSERASGESLVCAAALPGDYFVHNALMAAAAARRLGVGWTVIHDTLHRYRPLPGRWERRMVRGNMAINDAYNANPVSLRAAVAALREVPAARRWVVVGGMLELGAEEESLHRAAGVWLAAGAPVEVITVGPRGAWIAAGAREAGMPAGQLYEASDHAEAAARLRAEVAAGDVVLFKGSRGERVDRVLTLWESDEPS
jgi:UDP-N-acetylmuramoyl-tripeptide--D-alanyl-D-alanine ligase